MFNCCVSSDNRANRKIDKTLRVDRKILDSEVKLLLLGAGESGKSTIVKQARILHGDGYTDKQLIDFAPIIFMNILRSMQALINACPLLGINFGDDALEEKNLVSNMDTSSVIELKPNIRDAVTKLWQLESIQKVFTRRNEFQLNDSAKYYFENMERIGANGYIPSQDDVLRSRVPTTGVVEYKFNMSGVVFRLVDVGGQRSERRKWIHCFSGVTSIIFIVALSEYDQTLYEDRNQSRMRESMALFDNIVNYDWFADTSIILFLNKVDLFIEKIPVSPFNKYFPQYTDDPCDEFKVRLFITKKFFELNKNNEKTIYTSYTCATDKDNMLKIFDGVRQTILENNLKNIYLI